MKQSLKKNSEPTIVNSIVENNLSKWKQRKTTGTLVSLIDWKIYFDKFISVVKELNHSTEK